MTLTGAPNASDVATAKPHKLALEKVSKTFQTASARMAQVDALADVDLAIADGEFVCLVGPSGCGKSTILNLIAGLERPDSGRVLFDGKEVAGPGQDRMVLFQEAALFPWLTVLDNVLFGLELKRGLDRAQRKELALRHLERVGLARFAHAQVHELSGGMKQRVALARALAPDPRVLLMDEPFAALDALTREQLYGDLQRLWEEQKKTIVFVTHNAREAVCLGDRVLLLSPRPGRLRDEFLIDLPRPRDISSVELAQRATELTRALKAHARANDEELSG